MLGSHFQAAQTKQLQEIGSVPSISSRTSVPPKMGSFFQFPIRSRQRLLPAAKLGSFLQKTLSPNNLFHTPIPTSKSLL